ncbi:MAG TPA: hypothetical protein VMD05_00400 [Candidatus Nanoarchaeia archaeon]|nr:hypothetical protein [Candidatus Nanoarchaeia archaeon]
MPNNDRSKPISEVLKIAFEALKQHEKKVDKVNALLETRKDELLAGMEKLNTSLDATLERLDALESEFCQLKAILKP